MPRATKVGGFQNVFIEVAGTGMAGINAATKAVEQAGGRITHAVPPSVVVAAVPSDKLKAIAGLPKLKLATAARIPAATVRSRVVPAVVYVAASTPVPGTVRHHGRGDLRIGALDPTTTHDAAQYAQLQAIVAHFAAAEVGVTIAENVIAELWEKLMVNCAYNAISALAQATYAQLAAQPQVRALQESIVREVVAVAAADGIGLDLDASLQAMARIAVAMPGQLSSTAQDVARRKPTEIDHLNGFVARRGRALGVPVPVNETLHALVRLVEAGYRAEDDDSR